VRRGPSAGNSTEDLEIRLSYTEPAGLGAASRTWGEVVLPRHLAEQRGNKPEGDCQAPSPPKTATAAPKSWVSPRTRRQFWGALVRADYQGWLLPDSR